MRSQSFSSPPAYTSLPLVAGALVLALLLVVGTACDVIEASEDATTEALTLDVLITATTSTLDLSGPQSEQMGDIARRFRGHEPDPGALWIAAAEMHATLTSEQVDSLEARLRAASERFANRRGKGPPSGQRFGHRPPNGHGVGGPGRGPGPNGPGGPGAGLDLTDEQKEALRSIRETHHQQFLDLIAQYENGDASESDVATAYVELATILREEVNDVLTEEQQAQIEERREEREERREALQKARNEALSLSNVQANGFDAMLQLEKGPRSPGAFAANFDTWLAAREALLTDVQAEITIVHASLVAEHMRRKMQRRRGPGNGGRGGPGGW